jgi:hypothetical protein
MPSTILSGTAMCPFYKYDVDSTRSSIICEGYYGASMQLLFRTRNEKKEHADAFCASMNCENCEIYKLNMKKYEEET